MNNRLWFARIMMTLGILIVGTALFSMLMTSCSERLARAGKAATLSAIERGYKCREAGRGLAECQNEQLAAWERAR